MKKELPQKAEPETISVTEQQTMLAMGYRFMYKMPWRGKHYLGFIESDKERLIPCFDEKDMNYRFDVLSEANDYKIGTFDKDREILKELIKDQ